MISITNLYFFLKLHCFSCWWSSNWLMYVAVSSSYSLESASSLIYWIVAKIACWIVTWIPYVTCNIFPLLKHWATFLNNFREDTFKASIFFFFVFCIQVCHYCLFFNALVLWLAAGANNICTFSCLCLAWHSFCLDVLPTVVAVPCACASWDHMLAISK